VPFVTCAFRPASCVLVLGPGYLKKPLCPLPFGPLPNLPFLPYRLSLIADRAPLRARARARAQRPAPRAPRPGDGDSDSDSTHTHGIKTWFQFQVPGLRAVPCFDCVRAFFLAKGQGWFDLNLALAL
jgi:hypothetical protein